MKSHELCACISFFLHYTDHLLSYFLGGEANGNSNSDAILDADSAVERIVANGISVNSDQNPHNRPASQPSSSNALGRLSQSQNGFSSQDLPNNNVGAAASSSGQLRVHFSDDSLAAYQARQQGGVQGSNPTAATMHASQQRRFSASSLQNPTGSQGSLHKVPSTASTTGSSNSSLTNLAAALALGAPPKQVMIMQQQFQQAREEAGSTTPITPLNMMSPRSHETMMLPPPPRFPGNAMMPQNMSQQQLQMIQEHQQQQQQLQQQQGQMPQPIIHPSWNLPHQQANGSTLPVTTQQPVQFQQPSNQNHNQFPQTPHVGFPDPSSITSSTFSQQPPQTQQPQIHIGMNGQTVPVTAVTGPNGSVFYQIDPNVGSSANLRYFAKAINEVSKPVEQKEDPAVLAEKRQRRLARNRESARQSRRRKKERLVNLGGKVNQLQRQLEAEVRQKIQSMEAGLNRKRSAQIQRLWNEGGQQNIDELKEILQCTGVNSPIRRAVIAHQYDFLRQSFFASHSQFAVWLMRQSHNCFTASNFLKPAPAPDKDPNKKSTAGTRANSKLVGERLYQDENDGKGVTCQAHDELRVWPLYCYEVGMTMEQEERIVNQAHQEFNEIPNLQPRLELIHTAESTTNQMQNAMLCLSQVSSQRNESLLDILTPAQTVTLLSWVKKNKEKAGAIMKRQVNSEMSPSSLDNALQKLEGVRLQMNPPSTSHT